MDLPCYLGILLSFAFHLLSKSGEWSIFLLHNSLMLVSFLFLFPFRFRRLAYLLVFQPGDLVLISLLAHINSSLLVHIVILLIYHVIVTFFPF